MKRNAFFVVLMLVLCSVSGFGQEKFSAKVKVIVQHDSKSVVDTMYSYITRELRSLNDVTIVSDNEDYKINLLMLDVTVGGRLVGYAVSTTFLQPAKCTYKQQYLNGTPVVLDCISIQGSYIVVVPSDKLKENAQQIVVDFDTSILKTDREFFDLNNKYKKKQS